ncbi:MAG: S8 family serine peptidase [Armatimonadetes bacterium]|nr:S8 family serine peptidase [Armatimonadota bacterium]
MDPALRSLVEHPDLRPPSTVNIWTDSGGVKRVSVLLALQPDAFIGTLTTLGVRLNSTGSIASAEAPLSALRSLAAWSGLRYAEAARRSFLLLDRSIPEIRADLAWASYGRVGQGVLVGIVDSGIDFRHPDFRTPDGKTRIRYYWDQTAPQGPAPGDFPYGREYTQQQIDVHLSGGASLSPGGEYKDWEGHGTHVAGIAAGSGGGTNFIGVAPAADLIVVKWDGVHGLDANRYLMERARRLNRPVVVNNSWGGQYGPHDGTDAESQGLSDLVGEGKPGRVITFAAGNSGDKYIHLSGTLQKDEKGEGTLLAPAGQEEFEIEIWTDAAAEYQFGISYPTDLNNRNRTEVSVRSGEKQTQTVQGDSSQPYLGAVITLDARDRPYPLNPALQRFSLHVDLKDTPTGTVSGLPWTVALKRLNSEGNGQVDGWITRGYQIKFSAYPGKLSGDSRKTLINQACMKNGIAVGAYLLKNSWTTHNGETNTEPLGPQVPGEPAYFSSSGPTRDGKQKPELIAPGQWVASALSRDVVLPLNARRFLTPEGRHIHREGTSMACPHVTGTVALMLEADPGLDAIRIREMLIKGTGSAATWHPVAGYGKLDTFESLRLAVFSKNGLPGDLDGNGKLEVMDAVLSMVYALNLLTPSEREMQIGDVAPAGGPGQPPGDGRITVEDTIRILRRITDLEPDPWP